MSIQSVKSMRIDRAFGLKLEGNGQKRKGIENERDGNKKKTFKLSSFVINASIWMHKAFNLVTHCLMSKKDIENSLSLKTKASKSLRSTSIFVPYFCIMRCTLNPMPEYWIHRLCDDGFMIDFDFWHLCNGPIEYIYSNNEYDRTLHQEIWTKLNEIQRKIEGKTILLSLPSPKINFDVECCAVLCCVLLNKKPTQLSLNIEHWKHTALSLDWHEHRSIIIFHGLRNYS